MIRRTHTQTPHHGRKKDAENNDVCFFNPRVAAFEEVKKDADEEKEEATQEVGMNVDGFVMQVEERLEAFGQGVSGGWTVRCEDVGVILVPGWEGVVVEEEEA